MTDNDNSFRPATHTLFDMDDLSGLDWAAQPNGGAQKKPPMNPPSMGYQPSASPFTSQAPSQSPFGSGRNTPLQPQASSSSGPKQQPAAKPGQDSFSNLMKFGPTKSNQNLSLAERQQQLEAEKRKKLEERAKINASQGQFWEDLGSRGATPSQQPKPSNGTTNTDDDDLFAAFNKDTQVDNATHFPPDESQRSTPANAAPLDLSNPSAWNSAGASKAAPAPMSTIAPDPIEDDDDDPFGLNQMKQSRTAPRPQPAAEDDDFMGDLGRPVEEIRQKQAASQPQPAPGKPIDDDSSSDDEPPPARKQPARRQAEGRAAGGDDAFDRAVAQLVDYGFAPDEARRGLTESGAGVNVQAAANWLLDDAHRKAKAKSQGRTASPTPPLPARGNNKSPAGGEPDFAKTAASVGNSLFKTANSLWKTGQKRINQAVADFQQEGAGDPSQPKWLRDAQQEQIRDEAGRSDKATDEAMALESGGRPQPVRTNSRQAAEQRPRPQRQPSQTPSQTPQPSSSRNSPVPRWQQQSAPPTAFDAKARLRKLEADDDLSTYSSPNRRRRQPAPAKPKESEPEPDLLFGSEAPKASQKLPERPPPQRSAPPASKRPTPQPSAPVRPVPNRQIPAISPDALQKSTKFRHEGTAHFKRGDFATAHTSYSSSLNAVPATHPLAILLLTNRALTALKTGEPKQAVEDADQAINLIGPTKGTGETIAVRSETGQDEPRDMRDLYGKALSRKAEALEQMERWADAGLVWQICVEAGLGGGNAIKGRQRCHNAVAPKPKAAPKPAAKPRPKPSATSSLAPQKSSEAVSRLREANQAAAKEDDEKFALGDAVDAKVAAWRDGKRDNLRALLGSLDNVLWEGSGWKKVGMHELVMANKVKIVYMKAIAKTHPDKVSFHLLYPNALKPGSIY